MTFSLMLGSLLNLDLSSHRSQGLVRDELSASEIAVSFGQRSRGFPVQEVVFRAARKMLVDAVGFRGASGLPKLPLAWIDPS